MPENPAELHIVGVTGTGRLMHTIRRADGWAPFTDVLGPSAADQPDLQGYVTEVAAARVAGTPGTADRPGFPGALILAVLASTQPHPLFFCRYADTGHWVPLGAAVDVFGARRIAVAAATTHPDAGRPAEEGESERPARLHLAWTGRGGHLVVSGLRLAVPGELGEKSVLAEHAAELTGHAFRVPALAGAGAPAGSGDGVDEGTGAGASGGGFDRRAQHGPPARLRLAGLTANGRLFRMVVTATGATEVLGDVEAAGAGEAGEIVDTALAVAPDEDGCEYYAAVTGDGRILLSTNEPSGAGWRNWRDLEEADFVVVGPGGTMTYRDVAEFGTFARVALAITGDGLHVLGVTTSGRLLHQLQAGPATQPGSGQEFQDVELAGVGMDVGDFTAVAAA